MITASEDGLVLVNDQNELQIVKNGNVEAYAGVEKKFDDIYLSKVGSGKPSVVL